MTPVLDTVNSIVELTKNNPPALVFSLVVAVGVGQGAVFRWCDGLSKFRLRRVLELRDLLAPGAPGGEGLRRALEVQYEAEVYAHFLGAALDQGRRAALVRLFEDRGLRLDFALARRILPYVVFDGPRAEVANPDVQWRGIPWRRVMSYAATAAYFGSGSVAALCFATGMYFAPRSHATSVAAIFLGMLALVLAAAMLPPIWGYRALRRFTALAAAPARADAAGNNAPDGRSPVRVGPGAPSVAATLPVRAAPAAPGLPAPGGARVRAD